MHVLNTSPGVVEAQPRDLLAQAPSAVEQRGDDRGAVNLALRHEAFTSRSTVATIDTITSIHAATSSTVQRNLISGRIGLGIVRSLWHHPTPEFAVFAGCLVTAARRPATVPQASAPRFAGRGALASEDRPARQATDATPGRNVEISTKCPRGGQMATLEASARSTALHPTRRLVENAEADGNEFARDLIPIIDRDGSEGDPEWMTYPEYLETDEWREYRQGVLDRQNRECATCERDATHTHHRTYKNIGWEADNDCVGLCQECHKKMHGRRRRRKR